MRECKFCNAPLQRGLYENRIIFASRDYCLRPKCLARGKRADFEGVYSKQHEGAASRLSSAFLTRMLFIMRWGMEPIDAFGNYGDEAAVDWEHVFWRVAKGEALRVEASIRITDPEGGNITALEIDEAVMLPEGASAEREGRDLAGYLQHLMVNHGIHDFLEEPS